MKGFWRKWN